MGTLPPPGRKVPTSPNQAPLPVRPLEVRVDQSVVTMGGVPVAQPRLRTTPPPLQMLKYKVSCVRSVHLRASAHRSSLPPHLYVPFCTHSAGPSSLAECACFGDMGSGWLRDHCMQGAWLFNINLLITLPAQSTSPPAPLWAREMNQELSQNGCSESLEMGFTPGSVPSMGPWQVGRLLGSLACRLLSSPVSDCAE